METIRIRLKVRQSGLRWKRRKWRLSSTDREPIRTYILDEVGLEYQFFVLGLKWR